MLIAETPRIYVASKTTHVEMWRYYRKHGHNIISSWLDLEGALDVTEIGHKHWPIWLAEAASADFLIFYAVPNDRNHNSCLLEIAACLTSGGTILQVGVTDTVKTPNGELADFTYHPRWKRLTDIDRAFAIASQQECLPEE